jgi:hypothetical protein
MPDTIYAPILPEVTLRVQINVAKNAQQNYPIGSTNWVAQQTTIQNLIKTYNATYGTLGMAPGGSVNAGGQY